MARTEQKKTETGAIGHRKRLRERFLASEGKGMPDYELLEMLLFSAIARGDVKPMAKKLLNEFGSMSVLFAASESDIKKIDGAGEAVVTAIKVANACCVRVLQNKIQERPILQSWKALIDYCQVTMSALKKEQFRIFFLDHKNQLIADELQQEGTVDHTPVYPREIVKRALDLGASAIILVHNHPSGDAVPSKADINVTKSIIQAVTAVNITVHDHLIIGSNKPYSFASNGLL